MFEVAIKSQFARHVLTLVSGQGAAQLVSLAATPVIARLFIPEHFGVVALFIAIITVLTVPATLRFELATILPEKDDKAFELVIVSILAVVASCLLLFLLIAVMELAILTPAWLQPLGNWVWFIPVGLFAMAGIKITEGWATRKKQYKLMATTDFGQAVVTTGSRMAAGFAGGTSIWGLMLGYLLGLGYKLLVQFRSVNIPFAGMHARISKQGLIQAAREYRDFPSFNMPSGLIRTFSQNVPVIMFGVFFSPAVVGLYALANRLFRMPVNLLSKAIRRVYMQKLSDLSNSGQSLRPSYVKMTLALSVLTVLPTFLLWLFGADLAVLILGQQWVEAGRFVEILTPWLYTIITATPATAVIVVCRKQQIWLKYNIVVMLLQVAGFVFAYYQWNSAEYALMLFVAAGILANLFIIAYAYFVVTAFKATPANS